MDVLLAAKRETAAGKRFLGVNSRRSRNHEHDPHVGESDE